MQAQMERSDQKASSAGTYKGVYEFAAAPQPVKAKAKFRADEQKQPQGNPMNDKRVMKGPVLASSNKQNAPQENFGKSVQQQQEPQSQSKLQSKSRTVAREELLNQNAEEEYNEDGIQLGTTLRQENNWEILRDRQVEDESKLVPDFYLDRPPSPEFKPKEKGIEVQTQIYDDELFDFDAEVEPVLQVIIGRLMEQSRIELIEDFERVELEKHRRAYQIKRNAELMITQRMENNHIRSKEERERRKLQHEVGVQAKKIIHKKLVSRIVGKEAVAGILKQSINTLEDQGFLRENPIMRLKTEFLPKMYESIIAENKSGVQLFESLREVTAAATSSMIRFHESFVEKEMERRRFNQRERERLQKEKEEARIFRRNRRKLLRKSLAKQAVMNAIEEKLQKAVGEVENPLDSVVSSIMNQYKERPTLMTFGGLFFELCFAFDLVHKQFKELSGKADDAIYILNEKNVHDFVVKFLSEWCPTEISLVLRTDWQPVIEDMRVKMDQNLFEFNKVKTDKIESLLQETMLLVEPALQQSTETNLINHQIRQWIFKALLNIYFTSIVYRLPEPKPPVEKPQQEPQPKKDLPPKPEGEEGEDVKPEEGQQPAPAPEGEEGQPAGEQPPPAQEEPPVEEPPAIVIPPITPEEELYVKLREKIKLEFAMAADYSAFTRIRNVLNREVPKEGVEMPPNYQHISIDVQVKNGDFDLLESYIEPFDGTTFKKDAEIFPEVNPSVYGQTKARSVNMKTLADKNICVLDDRTTNVLRNHLIHLVKGSYKEFANVKPEEVLSKSLPIAAGLEEGLLASLIADVNECPIYDVELD